MTFYESECDNVVFTKYCDFIPQSDFNASSKILIDSNLNCGSDYEPTDAESLNHDRSIDADVKKSQENFDMIENDIKNTIVDPVISVLNSQRIKSPHSIIIGHVNVNSLRHKFSYFHDILSKGLLDILCVTETKLDETFCNNQFNCDGFRCHRKDKSCSSGGIMVWVRSDLPHERILEHEIERPSQDIENIVLLFHLKRKKFHLTCVYKKPSVTNTIFLNSVCTMYDKLYNSGCENILVGDINIDMSIYDNVVDNELCDVYGVKNIVKSPTCFKSERGTLIDPIIVSDPALFCKPFNVTCGSSDFHNMVGCSVNISCPKHVPSVIMYRDYKNFDNIQFKQELDILPVTVCNVFDSVDDQYWAFTNLYKSVLDEHAPLKTKISRKRKIPYMHSALMKAIHQRNRLKNVYYKNRNPQTWEDYRQYRNKVTKMRKSAIKNYFMKFSSKSTSPKDFWKCFRPFFTDKSANNSTDVILKENNKLISDKEQVCNIMNELFVSIADDIGKPVNIKQDQLFNVINGYNNHSSIIKIREIHSDPKVFNFMPVDPSHVMKLLKQIKTNKSTGYDHIPPKIAKLSSENVSLYLTVIFNNAFKSNTFPCDMKKSEVTPLYKKKDYMCKENYRPISIITIFSKIFESIISEQITEHMKTLFDKYLGAYRKGHGCSQVLIHAVNMWKNSLDNNMFVGTLMMDLSKAFDSIPHGLLLAKMKCYGFSNDACLFMASYLLDRKQRVKLNDCRSSWLTLKRGIPQGSCLGPLLFNIFVNDLFCVIENANLYNYADDNTLSVSHSSIEMVIDMLIKDTKNTMKWFLDNYMQANPEKFQVMFMKPPRNAIELPKNLSIDDVKLNTSEKVILLGVTIDNKLNFDQHVKLLCNKASRQLKILFRFKSLLGRSEKEQMYKTFILSNFNFCPVVWNFCSKTSARKIEKIQERALRFLTGYDSLTYSELLEKTGYSTLHMNRIKLITLEVFKCLYNLNTEFMSELFIVKQTGINLRDPCILILPKFNSIMYGKKTFTYYGAHLWNLLPTHYKDCFDLNEFKRMLSNWEGPKCNCNICNL